MATKNVEVLHVWELGTTGLEDNMSASLFYYTSSSSRASASETVTIAEIGSTGAYAITYTPTSAAVYYIVVSESYTLLQIDWEDLVNDAPATATASNAYCTEANVASFAQMGDYTANTVPTETQVLNFMEMRAAEVYGRLARVLGSAAPGPTGYDTTIDSTTDKGRAILRTTRLANALGAAMDAVEAAGAGESPSRSERVGELNALYNAALDELAATAKSYLTYSQYARTHYDEGRVSRESISSSSTESGLTFDGSTKW